MIHFMRILIAILAISGIAIAGPTRVVTYDADHLDLEKRTLQFKVALPATEATIVAIGEDGSELGTGSATFAKTTPTEWQTITWTQPDKARVMMLKLRVVLADAKQSATNVELIPWSVSIDHEDVNFAVDSAVIDATGNDHVSVFEKLRVSYKILDTLVFKIVNIGDRWLAGLETTQATGNKNDRRDVFCSL